jgi:hypothetical protein
VIPAQAIRSRWKTLQRRNEGPPPLRRWLEDARNLVWLCFNHHINGVENVRVYLKPGDLPDGFDDFAGEVGLAAYVEERRRRER